MNTQEEQSHDQQENERLRLEVVQLKENLEKEQFFHKAVYKQWYELNANMLAKERDLKQLKAKNLLYKYTFYFILFSAPFAYYLQSRDKKDETNTGVSQTVSSPLVSSQAPVINSVAAIPSKINPEKKERAEANDKHIKLMAEGKPLLVEKLSDSVWYSIYWEGWTAYYQKSSNPYQKASGKYQVWLKGWEKADNETKKLKMKASSDTLNSLVGNATSVKQ
jgi:hypothetical protein